MSDPATATPAGSAPASASAATHDLPPRVPFVDARAKARAVAAVKTFESHTSAELVITVKKRARTYREAHLSFGLVVAAVTLLFLLFYPRDFSTTFMPVDTLIGFAVGYGLSRFVAPIERLAVPASTRRAVVEQAAKAAFFDLGVSKTTGRTGVLVYVALFEQMVAIIVDAGVTTEARRAAEATQGALEAALARVDMGAFAETLERLGPAFAPTMARAADDVNELSDEIT